MQFITGALVYTKYIVDLVVMLHFYLDHVEGLKSLRTRL